MEDYIKLFIDQEDPQFLNKYQKTSTLERIKYVTQFCGCDYTGLYNPLFLYTRFDHSLVVAHMTWHFTKSKKETIAALLHDVGTPCFAHCIDYVFGDYINQESSEKSIVDMIKNDRELQYYLEQDQITLQELQDFYKYPILENKTPNLCTDRLDGVFHTCYIWLHTHSLSEIKEVYDNLTILKNEKGLPEIGFTNQEIAEKFVSMNYVYAKELLGNTDKSIMKYISEVIKEAVNRKLITLEDLYTRKEQEIIAIIRDNFPSWESFTKAKSLTRTETKPEDHFYISFASKKRNVIPLVQIDGIPRRMIDISSYAQEKYRELEHFHDSTYAYLKKVKKI